MNDTGYNNWNKLRREFNDLTNYYDKLTFYADHFSIIPNDFPVFNPQLDIFLKEEHFKELLAISQKERMKNATLIKRIDLPNGRGVIFNAAPTTKNRQLLNEFIIGQFIAQDAGFKNVMSKIDQLDIADREIINDIRNSAKSLLCLISHKLSGNYETSFRNQFLHIFYTGYKDYELNVIKRFSIKRKLIELYIYAQGILFAKYVEAVNHKMFVEAKLDKPSLKNRINLFYKLGIIDHLRRKLHSEQKLIESISEITGEKCTVIEKLITQPKMEAKVFL